MAVTQEERFQYTAARWKTVLCHSYPRTYSTLQPLQPEKDCKSRHANEVMQLHVIHNLADIRILPEYDIDVTITWTASGWGQVGQTALLVFRADGCGAFSAGARLVARECWMIYRGPGFLAGSSVSSTGDKQEDWERETTCWRELGRGGVVEEPNHTTARKPGPL